LIDDLSTDGRFPARDGVDRYRTGSLLSVPIRYQQRIMGVLNVNNKRRRYRGPTFQRLIDVLRIDFGLTGTKEGCGEGECGACSVLVDGKVVNSCLIPVGQMEGRKIETIESLGTPTDLHELQQSFLEHGGAQCGICTPGMLMSALAHVREGGSASDSAIRERLAGNLCRCTGYQHIVTSIAAVLRKGRRK
jgi:carbon-monoxide dehydrogenase small subunit